MREFHQGTKKHQGAALPVVLGVSLVLLGLLVVLHMIRTDRVNRLKLKLLERRADFMARSALSHSMHKVQRCLVHIDELIDKNGGQEVDLGKVEKGFLDQLQSIAVPFDKGRSVGFYKVQSLKVRRQKVGDNPAYTLAIAVDGSVESRPEKPPKVYRKRIEKELYLASRSQSK